MKFLKEVTKMMTVNRILFLVGLLVLAVIVGQYSMSRNKMVDGMSGQYYDNEEEMQYKDYANKGNQEEIRAGMATPPVQPAPSDFGQMKEFAQVKGNSVSPIDPPCVSAPRQFEEDPSSLLPKDVNNEWARLNPTGQGNLDNVNLLKAGYHLGIDRVNQTLRNANLQLRSEPPNPKLNVGPWMNTTIEPDLTRVPLEIGQGYQ